MQSEEDFTEGQRIQDKESDGAMRKKYKDMTYVERMEFLRFAIEFNEIMLANQNVRVK
jgi:hypothetical protein